MTFSYFIVQRLYKKNHTRYKIDFCILVQLFLIVIMKNLCVCVCMVQCIVGVIVHNLVIMCMKISLFPPAFMLFPSEDTILESLLDILSMRAILVCILTRKRNAIKAKEKKR